MESTEGRNERAGAGSDRTDNVVHFPRDWFGPVEELVPFGPRASERSSAPAEPGLVEDPDVFWGEDASSLHNVVSAPAFGAQDDGHRHGPLLAGGLSLLARGRPLLGRGRPLLARGRIRYTLALAALAVTSFLAAAIRQLGGTSAGPGRPVAAITYGTNIAAALDNASQESGPGPHEKLASRATHHDFLHRRASAHHRTAAAAGSVSSAAGGGGTASSAQPVVTSVPSTSGVAAGLSRSSGSGASGGGSGSNVSSGSSGSPSAGSAMGRASTSGSGGGSAPAGPQGPGAPFGPGQLGSGPGV